MVRIVNLIDDGEPELEVVVYRSGKYVVVVINGSGRCVGRLMMTTDGGLSGPVTAEAAKCWPKSTEEV